jgi:Uncharacterized protein conserved in bacteria
MARRQTGCSFETVRNIAAELPDVEEGIAWRVPVWRLRGRILACTASNKSAEPNTLVVIIGFDQRDAMIADDPATYYLKPHYENYPSVLVRLSQIKRDALKDLLQAAWRFVDASAPKRRRPAARKARRT